VRLSTSGTLMGCPDQGRATGHTHRRRRGPATKRLRGRVLPSPWAPGSARGGAVWLGSSSIPASPAVENVASAPASASSDTFVPSRPAPGSPPSATSRRCARPVLPSRRVHPSRSDRRRPPVPRRGGWRHAEGTVCPGGHPHPRGGRGAAAPSLRDRCHAARR